MKALKIKMNLNNKLILFFCIMMISAQLIYPQYYETSKLDIGAGIIYSSPLNNKFQRVAGNGFGGAIAFMREAQNGCTLGLIEYIQYNLPEGGRDERYYQVNFNVIRQYDLTGGFGPIFGAVVVGYHNWEMRTPTFHTFGEISEYYDEGEGSWVNRTLRVDNKFYYFPFTFYSIGIGYENIFTQNISLNINVRYTFDLAFTKKSWQMCLSFTVL